MAGNADHRGHVEGQHAHDHQDRHDRQEGRPQNRQSYSPQHLPAVGARHQGSLFERGVEGADGRRQHEHRGRDIGEHLDENDAGQAVDIEPLVDRTDQRLHRHRDDADARRKHQRPADGKQQRRRRHRHQDHGAKQIARRQIGPFQEPAQRRREDDGEECAAAGEDQRVDDEPPIVGRAPHLDVMFDRPAGRGGQPVRTEAADQQNCQRHQRENSRAQGRCRPPMSARHGGGTAQAGREGSWRLEAAQRQASTETVVTYLAPKIFQAPWVSPPTTTTLICLGSYIWMMSSGAALRRVA